MSRGKWIVTGAFVILTAWGAFWFLRAAHLEGCLHATETELLVATAAAVEYAGKYTDERNRNAVLCDALEITSRATLTALVKLSVEAGMPYTPDEIEFIRDQREPVPFPETEPGGAIPDGPSVGYGGVTE